MRTKQVTHKTAFENHFDLACGLLTAIGGVALSSYKVQPTVQL